MRRAGNSSDPYNPAASASRGRGNNPYPSASSFRGGYDDGRGYYRDEDDEYGGSIVPPVSLRLLGPLAPVLLSDDPSDPEILRDRLRTCSVSLLGISLFFWTWAMYNTFHLRKSSGGFDLGVASFFGSGTSSLMLLRSALGGKCYDSSRRFGCCGKKGESADDDVDVYGIRKSNRRRGGEIDDSGAPHVPPGSWLRGFALLTHLTVVANYLLGVLFAFTAGTRVYVYFATYCLLFSILWIVAAFSGWVLVGAYREALARAYGQEVLAGPSRPSLLRGALRALISWFGLSKNAETSGYYQDEEDDEIDDELRMLYEGRGGYTND